MKDIATHIPKLAVLALGLWLGASLFYISMHKHSEGLSRDLLESYGQSLANSTAREAIEAAFRNDLVSLQALVKTVTNNPKVVRATIANVEQDVLVQSGVPTQITPTSAITFQSAITMHDSIAGFVLITIDATTAHTGIFLSLYLLCSLTCLLLILITCWRDDDFVSILRSLTQQIFAAKAKFSSAVLLEDDGNASAASEESTPSNIALDGNHNDAPVSQYAYLALCVKNTTVLKQQLSGDAFRKTLGSLDALVSKIGKFYGLVQYRWSGDRYIVQFSAHNQESALFNAACSARLLLDCGGKINRIPLHLSAQVSLDEENVMGCELPFTGIAVDNTKGALTLLNNKIEYLDISEGDDRKIISRFCQPYRDLLKNQTLQCQND